MKKSEHLTFSQALGDSESPSNHWDSKLSLSVNQTHTPKQSSEKTTPIPQYTMMSKPYQQENLEESTVSVEDGPVLTSQMLEKGKDYRESDQDFGMTSPELLANYDQESQSWKTSQRCFIEGWATYSATWPRSGMTVNGIAYQLPTLAQSTTETEYSLLPTPAARDWKGARSIKSQQEANRGERNSLPDYFRVKGNWLYPPVAVVEYMMGLNTGYTGLDSWVTQSTSPSSKKLEKG